MENATGVRQAQVKGYPKDEFASDPRKIAKARVRSRRKQNSEEEDSSKRRCVSTACIACRKRKSKCDGNTPACAACSQVYGTECVYNPNSDHRRKGVYKTDIDNLKTRDSTSQTLIQALLNYPEEDVPELVRQIRTCESLDDVAETIVAKEHVLEEEDDDDADSSNTNTVIGPPAPTFEMELSGKVGQLRVDDGTVRYIGGTSHLIYLGIEDSARLTPLGDEYQQQEHPITSWTTVTSDPELVVHLLNMYFTWHYTYFTTLCKSLFYRDFLLGMPPENTRRKTQYCTPLLVNAILALGCHFTSHAGARDNPEDSATAGDHFFREAKRLIMENDEHEKPRLTTVQALALMSVREAGCGREDKGWVYSGMSFRMACDMGLNLDSGSLSSNKNTNPDGAEEDVRRITFWGCYLFDKCWSNYLGRLPQLPTSLVTAPKFEVFPDEDAAQWSPYTDSGFMQAHAQPGRTRAVALQISTLCEISNDLMTSFYNPSDMDKAKGKQIELKELSEIHTRLENWRRHLPKEMEPKEGCLSSVLVMHMFFQLLFIHLFRPFLKYNQATSPLPQTVSPRKLCTQAAAMISKLLRLYKRSHGLRQICNIAVYIAHCACTIHLLNLPEKNARRDIIHGVKHLEEIAEGWLCARRTLGILSALARKWNVEMPQEAAAVLARTDAKVGTYNGEVQSPVTQQQQRPSHAKINPSLYAHQQAWQNPAPIPTATDYFTSAPMSSANAGAVARTYSAKYSLPRQDVKALLGLHHHSAANTPASTSGPRTSSSRETNKSGVSPSDMFGGVEALIRESNDWVYRDQAQLATGFENWNLSEDASAWMNGVMPNNGNVAMAVSNAGITNSHRTAKAVTSYGAEGAGGRGYPLMNGVSDVYGHSLTAYNEDEWYQ